MMTTELEKALVILEHEGTPYFISEDYENAYHGTEEDARSRYTEELHEDEVSDYSFDRYCYDNEKHIEEYDEDRQDKYRVYTDEEADEEADKYLRENITEYFPHDMDTYHWRYVDEEAWRDDMKSDGRGSLLSSYDSEEHEIKINGTTYYLYRIN